MKKILFFLILISTHYISPAALATSLLPISLEQLSTRATTVFYGVVTGNKVSKDERTGHIATFTSFEILESIKGDIGETHTIKQIGGYHKQSNMRHHVYGVPSFQVGKEYIVFLPEVSSLGFSSPLGLQQGRVTVTSDNGEKFVGDGHRQDDRSHIISHSKHADDHNGIQIPVTTRSDNDTRTRLDDFIKTIRAYNKSE
jgi:hypothetical protein